MADLQVRSRRNGTDNEAMGKEDDMHSGDEVPDSRIDQANCNPPTERLLFSTLVETDMIASDGRIESASREQL
jgi:hypothetical protein